MAESMGGGGGGGGLASVDLLQAVNKARIEARIERAMIFVFMTFIYAAVKYFTMHQKSSAGEQLTAQGSNRRTAGSSVTGDQR
jgi:hypothetical protein